MTSRVLVSLRVEATPGRAFDVFTREIGLWWQPNDLFRFSRETPGRLAFEARIGGAFTETHADGTVFEIGRVRAWEPGARLIVSWRQASFTAGQETEVEVRFDPAGDETRVTVEHRGWDTVPQAHVARHGFPLDVFLRRHGEWWQGLLARVKAAV